MANIPVLDPLAEMQKVSTLNKVLTTKAAIAQTPKKLVWTLNKAKLYRYVPVVPASELKPTPLLLVFALMNRPSILDLRPGNSFVEFMLKQGYDVYRVVLDNKGNVLKYEPFLTGFLVDAKADPPMWGRPVDVLVMKDGSLLVSDDYNGIVYRVSYKK